MPKCAKTVESILADIDARKDQAVKDLSKKFDKDLVTQKIFVCRRRKIESRHCAGARARSR